MMLNITDSHINTARYNNYCPVAIALEELFPNYTCYIHESSMLVYKQDLKSDRYSILYFNIPEPIVKILSEINDPSIPNRPFTLNMED